MTINDFIGKGKRFLAREKEIARMEWGEFTANTIEDVKAWEGVYDTSIEIKDKNYTFKKKNIALLKMPESFEEYKSGKQKQAFRTNYNSGVSRGYQFRSFLWS